jgi:hypothetical protein
MGLTMGRPYLVDVSRLSRHVSTLNAVAWQWLTRLLSVHLCETHHISLYVRLVATP